MSPFERTRLTRRGFISMLAGTAAVAIAAPKIFLPHKKSALEELQELAASYNAGVPTFLSGYMDPRMLMVRPLVAGQLHVGDRLGGPGIPDGTRIIALVRGHDHYKLELGK